MKKLIWINYFSAGNLLTIYLTYLRQNDIVTDEVSANVLVRKWNPAFKEWNTKSVRDVFFSSPQFPRLLNPESIKMTIANAVSSGILRMLLGQMKENMTLLFLMKELVFQISKSRKTLLLLLKNLPKNIN